MASSRRQYPFHLIEPKWQQFWDIQQTFRAWNPGESVPEGHPVCPAPPAFRPGTATRLPPKFYILDMFPYPSGAGLHVGHRKATPPRTSWPATGARRGFNVLHPMGWDAFGLPAEQYAIKTGQHPRKTTEANIATFKRQIKVARLQLRLDARGGHDRPGVFQVDAVDFPQALQLLVQSADQQGRADRDAPLPARAAKQGRRLACRHGRPPRT